MCRGRAVTSWALTVPQGAWHSRPTCHRPAWSPGHTVDSSCPSGTFFVFFKILFVFTERGRKRDREGEKHQFVAVSRAPLTGDLAQNPGMCPDRESNLRPFGSQDNAQPTLVRTEGTVVPVCCVFLCCWGFFVFYFYFLQFYNFSQRLVLITFTVGGVFRVWQVWGTFRTPLTQDALRAWCRRAQPASPPLVTRLPRWPCP